MTRRSRDSSPPTIRPTSWPPRWRDTATSYRWWEGRRKVSRSFRTPEDRNRCEERHLHRGNLEWLGDSYTYAGAFGDAKQQYDKATAVAARAKDREQAALSRFGPARLDILQGRGNSAMPVLQKLVAETDSIGLKSTIGASLHLSCPGGDCREEVQPASRNWICAKSR